MNHNEIIKNEIRFYMDFPMESIEISYSILVELLVFAFKPQFLCSSSGEVGVGGLIISPEIMFIHPISLF